MRRKSKQDEQNLEPLISAHRRPQAKCSHFLNEIADWQSKAQCFLKLLTRERLFNSSSINQLH